LPPDWSTGISLLLSVRILSTSSEYAQTLHGVVIPRCLIGDVLATGRDILKP
jgi:hypothetical protein